MTGHETRSRKMQKYVVCEIWPYFLEKNGNSITQPVIFLFGLISERKRCVSEFLRLRSIRYSHKATSVWCFLCVKWKTQATRLKNIISVACKILIILNIFKYLIKKQIYLMLIQSCRCFAFKQLYYSHIASQDSF